MPEEVEQTAGSGIERVVFTIELMPIEEAASGLGVSTAEPLLKAAVEDSGTAPNLAGAPR